MFSKRFFDFFLIFFCLLFAERSFSQSQEISLKNKAPSWITVSEGETVLPPVAVPDGFIILHDGNKICGISDDGTRLWQKKVRYINEKSILAASPEGFVYFSGSDNILYILNPSGVTLLQISLPFPPINTILTGLDGRFFVFGKQQISCYGLNGVCKWYILTANQSNCRPVLLSDGSLLVFLESAQQSGFEAVRISPFGEELDRITLTSQPLLSCSDVKNAYVLCFDKTVKIVCVKNDKASLFSNFNIPHEIDLEHKTLLAVDSIAANSLVLADGTELLSFDYQTGRLNRKIDLNLPDLLEGRFITNGSYFLYCNQSWETVFYRIAQTPAKGSDKKISAYELPESGLYFSNSSQLQKTAESLKKGHYGAAEKTFIGDFESFCNEYYSLQNSKTRLRQKDIPEYITNLPYILEAFSQAGLYGSSQFNHLTAQLMQSDISETLLIQLVKTAGEIAYDPDSVLFDTIEKKIMYCPVPFKRHTEFLTESCVSLYKISRYMGKASGTRASKILSFLLNGTYGTKVNNKAENLLEKIAALEP